MSVDGDGAAKQDWRGDYRQLPWDSQHFGFPVGRLDWTPDLPRRLPELLRVAASDRCRLLYLTIPEPSPLSDLEVERLGGRVMGRRVTYAGTPSRLIRTAAGDVPMLSSVTEAAPGMAGADLISLAITAGEFSRFRRDPQIPTERFETLYRQWLERSLAGELADTVLTAAEGAERPAGLITLAVRDQAASIGLIAVSAAERGRGWGRALLAAAASWTAARGLATLTVETQQENTAACRLYSRCGFQPRQVAVDVHFWLNQHGGGA